MSQANQQYMHYLESVFFGGAQSPLKYYIGCIFVGRYAQNIKITINTCCYWKTIY